MKKMLLYIFMALGGLAHSAATSTPTFTPTLTHTPTAVAILSGFGIGNNRAIVYPVECTQDNGVVMLSTVTTPLPGAGPWVAAVQNQNCLVFSTGTAKARFSFTVPMDYERGNGNLRLFLHGNDSATNTTTAFAANVNVAYMNRLTSTVTSYLGVTFNVKTGYQAVGTTISLTNTGWRLLDSRWSRFLVPISSTVAKTLNPGDTVNIEIVKAQGVDAQVSVSKFELEYNKVMSGAPTSGR